MAPSPTITFRLPEEDRDLVYAAAKLEGRPVSNWIARAVREKLERDGAPNKTPSGGVIGK